MMKRYLAAIVLLALALPVRAETPQEEATRRGVPLEEVQTERALADEKNKEKALNAKLADLQKQLADLQTKQNPVPAGGEDMYKDFEKRYLAGDWEHLVETMKGKAKEIQALPAEEAANVAYMEDAIAEGRQAWWDAIKGGKTGAFTATVWKQDVDLSYSNGPGKFSSSGKTELVSWPKGDMDSFVPMSMADVGLQLGGNFHKADGISQLIWGYVSFGYLNTTFGPEKLRQLTPAQRSDYATYSGFISGVTTAYYGTPTARRLMMAQCLAAFEPSNDQRPDWLGKRPIGAAMLIEMHDHPKIYENLSIYKVYGLDSATKDGHEYEEFDAKALVLGMASQKLPFEEDKALRESFKTLGQDNATFNATIALPDNLSYDLNVQKDLPLAADRQKFLQGRAK